MADEETTGHEAELDSMDDSAFQDALNAKMAEGDKPEADDATPASTQAGDTESHGKPLETKPEAGTTEPKPFKLSREQQPPAPEGDTGQGDEDGGELVPIIHRGQEIKVTSKRLKELAQKGFDYDYKVGPHSRIVQLVTEDRTAAEILDGYIQAKMQGKPFRYGQPAEPVKEPAPNPFEVALKNQKPVLKPLRDFATEEDWLMANAPVLGEMFRPKEAPKQEEPRREEERQPSPAQNPVIMRLMARDPDGFGKVAPILKQTAQKYLTVEQMQEIERDPEELVRFYDWTRANVLNMPPATTAQAPQQERTPQKEMPPAKPGFRARSGGGSLDREAKSGAQKIWDLPNKDFAETMQKIKNGELVITAGGR